MAVYQRIEWYFCVFLKRIFLLSENVVHETCNKCACLCGFLLWRNHFLFHRVNQISRICVSLAHRSIHVRDCVQPGLLLLQFTCESERFLCLSDIFLFANGRNLPVSEQSIYQCQNNHFLFHRVNQISRICVSLAHRSIHVRDCVQPGLLLLQFTCESERFLCLSDIFLFADGRNLPVSEQSI